MKMKTKMNFEMDLNEALADIHPVEQDLQELFSANPKRFQQFSLEVNNILLDYSKQKIDSTLINKLCNLAEAKNLSHHIQSLFSGEIVNTTEKRAALHTLLRDSSEASFLLENKNIKTNIQSVLSRMAILVEHLEKTNSYKTIISLGIGGSDLGPAMVTEALKSYKKLNLDFHFISNIDVQTLANTLNQCNPETTLCIINSKTFTTPETLLNAKTIKAWMLDKLSSTEVLQRLFAVTADIEKAEQFGILKNNIFEFWDFVGGRYSIWSAVGLPVALMIGIDQFKAFLNGAYQMDQHFRTAPFAKNMPVLMALLGIWNINKLGYHSHAIIPYDDCLAKFPDYLQQLMMESNGKRVNKNGEAITYSTAPIIWGGVGCNGQHAYMQLLHQGTEIVPIDFLVAGKPSVDLKNTMVSTHLTEQHKLLVASCLTQSKTLMEGTRAEDENDPLKSHKFCPGNRPSNTIMYPSLSPEVLGALIALYEHIVYVQSVMWDINPFDQYGVELGKKVVKKMLPYLEEDQKFDLNDNLPNDLDSSSIGLIKFFHQHGGS